MVQPLGVPLAAAGVEAATGLTATEASSRLATYGPNKFAEAKADPVWLRFLRQYQDLMQIVLLVAGIVSIVIVGTVSTGLMLLLLTVFNALMGLSQEGKAAAAVAAAGSISTPTDTTTAPSSAPRSSWWWAPVRWRGHRGRLGTALRRARRLPRRAR